jgi:outer membrane receptor protein involved in Fe transport
MIKRGTGRWLAGVSALALATGVAQAQDTANTPEETAQDDVIVVTASRREESLQDTALSVTAINPDEMALNGLTRLREVVEFAPGVHFSGGGSPIGNTITMRGVAQTGRASTVGIYVDDVPIGSSNSFAAGPSLHFDGVQGDVERVELVRGPQGTLYGSSSMGGVVRYITRDPSTQAFEGNVQADVSTTEEGGVNQNFSGRIAIPLVEDRIGLSVAGYYEDFGGFIDRIAASPTGAAEDVDAYEREGISVRLVANPTERIRTALMFMQSGTTSTGGNVVALAGPPFTPVNGPFATDEGAAALDDDFSLYAATFSYEFDWGTLISSTSYQERSNSNAQDLVATFGTLIDLLSGNPAGTTTSAFFTGLTRTERYVQEIRLSSNGDGPLEWTVGGIYSDEDSSNIQTLYGEPTNFLALDVDLGSELVEYAAFGNLTYYLNPDFDLTFGARLAGIESSVSLVDGPQLIVANLPETTSEDTVDTYSFTARYRPSDNLSLYGRIASGYRPQNANLPLLDAQGNNAAPAIIATDTLWSYELGAKGSSFDGNIEYDVAVWYIDWKDLQAVTFVNGATTGGNANSDVTAYGFEGSLAWRPADGVSIVGGLAYSNSTLDDDETAAFGALAGENLRLLPEWSGSIQANYDFAISPDMLGFISGAVRYVGERDTGYEGGVTGDGTVIAPLIANFTLDDYVVTNISGGISRGPVTATVYVNNVFDEYAFTGGSARPVVGFTRATANVLQPRTIGAVLSVDF